MLKILALLLVGILIMVIGKERYEYYVIIYDATVTVEIRPLRNIECLTRWCVCVCVCGGGSALSIESQKKVTQKSPLYHIPVHSLQDCHNPWGQI